MFSLLHNLLDDIQLYNITSHFCHAADEGQFPYLINHYCAVHIEYLHTKFK
jgi:hypothetical protein